MDRIPSDVIGDIFEHLARDENGGTKQITISPPRRTTKPITSYSGQFIVSSVSHQWRQIAHSRGRLWSNIRINLGGFSATGIADCLSALLARYKGEFLKVGISEYGTGFSPIRWTDVDRELLELVLQHSDRIWSLRLCVGLLETCYIKGRFSLRAGHFSSLHKLNLRYRGRVPDLLGSTFYTAPRLAELVLDGIPYDDDADDSHSGCFPLAQIIRFTSDYRSVWGLSSKLEHMSSLEHLQIANVEQQQFQSSGELDNPKPHMVLPNLTSLIDLGDQMSDSNRRFFSTIQTPHLKTLQIKAVRIQHVSTLRANCGFNLVSLSITKISIGDPHLSTNAAIISLINTTTTLQSLALSFVPSYHYVPTLQVALETYLTSLLSLLTSLPDLRVLKLHDLALVKATAGVLMSGLDGLLSQRSLQDISVQLLSLRFTRGNKDALVDAPVCWEQLVSWTQETFRKRPDLKLGMCYQNAAHEVHHVTNKPLDCEIHGPCPCRVDKVGNVLD